MDRPVDASQEEGALDVEPESAPEPSLFAPGPLASLEIAPRQSRIPPNATRTLRGRPLDADRRPASGEVAVHWRLEGSGELRPEGLRVLYVAPAFPASAVVHAVATQRDVACEASAAVEVLADTGDPKAGIPEPTPVQAPAETGRSRVHDRSWEYNTGHRDYLAASSSESRRLRYLVQLFAKEIVLRIFGGDPSQLERMVEVLTYLDESESDRSRAADARGDGAPEAASTG